MTQVQVRLFGAFRNFSNDSPSMTLSFPDSSAPTGFSVSEIKDALSLKLGHDAQALIQDSVLATEDRVLLPEDRVPSGSKLAILPPVCGG